MAKAVSVSTAIAMIGWKNVHRDTTEALPWPPSKAHPDRVGRFVSKILDGW